MLFVVLYWQFVTANFLQIRATAEQRSAQLPRSHTMATNQRLLVSKWFTCRPVLFQRAHVKRIRAYRLSQCYYATQYNVLSCDHIGCIKVCYLLLLLLFVRTLEVEHGTHSQSKRKLATDMQWYLWPLANSLHCAFDLVLRLHLPNS